jgi:hypothetical protein
MDINDVAQNSRMDLKRNPQATQSRGLEMGGCFRPDGALPPGIRPVGYDGVQMGYQGLSLVDPSQRNYYHGATSCDPTRERGLFTNQDKVTTGTLRGWVPNWGVEDYHTGWDVHQLHRMLLQPQHHQVQPDHHLRQDNRLCQLHLVHTCQNYLTSIPIPILGARKRVT